MRPGSPDDQTRALQRAIDEAARAQVPLALPPGVYRTGMLRLQNGAQLVGVRGATKLVFTGGASLLQSEGADISASPASRSTAAASRCRHGAAWCIASSGRDIRITDCEITDSGGNGIWLEDSGDDQRQHHSQDRHHRDRLVRRAGPARRAEHDLGTNDNGIEILRHAIGDDGTMVIDNRIEDIKAGPGGSGQYGNAINAFRAGNVIVRGNRIRNCDYSGGARQFGVEHPDHRQQRLRCARGRAVFGIRVRGRGHRQQHRRRRGARRLGLQFQRGRPHRVVQGNIIRNLLPKRPIGTAPDDDAGIGIYVEADTSVTGNVIENAPSFGIIAGWGKYLRDVAITGNVIRNDLRRHRRVGGAGRRHGAGQQQHDLGRRRAAPWSGLDHARPVTSDLSAEGAQRYAQVVVGSNAVRR